MKPFQPFVIIFSILFASFCFSQVNFEPGYYIDIDGNLIKGMVENEDWNRNPKSFRFRKNEQSEAITLTVDEVKEFGVDEKLKYLGREVAIDRSREQINLISYSSNPNFLVEKLFLKELINGSASLYQYIDGEVTRYFFSVADDSISQLVYKVYKYQAQNAPVTIRYNYQYRQQLLNGLDQCPKIGNSNFANLEYDKRDLVKLFENYNACVGSDYTAYPVKNEIKGKFQLRLTPGINYSSARFEYSVYPFPTFDYKSKITWRMGLEAEYILPFNRNKWSIFFEPSYHSRYEDIITETVPVFGRVVYRARYENFEVALGARHFLFLDPQIKVFVNAAMFYDQPLNSSVNKRKIVKTLGASVGLGLSYKTRWSAETRFYAPRNSQADYQLNKLSIVLGYILF